MELIISLLGLSGTFFVAFRKVSVQKFGMYLWICSNVIAIPFFFTHHMYYLTLLNLAYAAVSVMGIYKRRK